MNLKSPVLVSAVSIAALSQAVVLNPDTYTALPGNSSPAGTVIEDDFVAFNFGGGIEGTVRNRVVRKADDTLAFIWQVSRTDFVTTKRLEGFRLGNFVTDVYDADYSTTSTGTVPAYRAYLFGDSPSVNFNFQAIGTDPGILAQQESKFFYLDTTATQYARTALYDLTAQEGNDFYISLSRSTFAPVPEPATMTLLGAGALAALARRRKKQ